MEEDAVDPVPVISRTHFEEAFHAARRSVSTHDLYKFDEFRKKMDPAYAKRQGDDANVVDITLNWPEDNSAQFQEAGDDDDLYD